MFTVTLIRGPLPSKTWEHSTKRAAEQRAYCLADLHSVEYEQAGDAFTLNASAKYERAAQAARLRKETD